MERSPRAVSEGTWAVFAEKVVRERDDALALLAEAKKEIEGLRRKLTETQHWRRRADSDMSPEALE